MADTGKQVEIIVKYSGDIAQIAKRIEGTQVVELLNEYAILKVDADALDEVERQPEIEYVERPVRLYFTDIEGIRASCITALQRPAAQTGLSLYGDGVLVGIVDSGIDYTHPDFRNTDGTSRIAWLWDQTISPEKLSEEAIPAQPPKGYVIGAEYDNAKINEALSEDSQSAIYRRLPSRDLSGHGTHVAGIAAGNGRASDGDYAGVAPKSTLIVVKLASPEEDSFPSTSELLQAVNYCVSKALSMRMPLALNLSFGNTYGSHAGTSLVERFFDDISNYWKTSIVIGMGNEGAAAGHTSGILKMGETKEVELAVGIFESGFRMQIWKNYVDIFSVSVRSPSGEFAGPVEQENTALTVDFSGVTLQILYGAPTPNNLYQEISVEFLPKDLYLPSGIWTFLLTPRRIVQGVYDMWLPSAAALSASTAFLSPTEEITLTIPATARGVISVGAYDARTLQYADFSGRGYTWQTGQIKPDLSAPGVSVISCAPGGSYQSKSGTSMAAPFVTGSAALLQEWGIVRGNDPFLYGEKLKAYLQKGAKSLPGFTKYPNEQVGYGEDVIIRSHSRKPVKSSVSTRFPRTETKHFNRYFEENLPGLDSKCWCGCDL